MGVNRFLLQKRDARLCFRAFRDAARGFSPVVKNLWNVTDPRRLFAQAEHEFEVLDAVERGIEPRLQGELATDAQKMADIHRAAEIFRRPLRLEERLHEPPGWFVEL